MKFMSEYRDAESTKKYIREIKAISTKKWVIMEICGGQTHALLKYGIDEILQDSIQLLHGPGCPVCVTPLEKIDKAIKIASRPDVIFCSFGDMLRVPGSTEDLLSAKARGRDIRIVYSPMDALDIARQNPDKNVVFFGIGFETTVPAVAMAVYQAYQSDISNFSVLVSHVLVPPAIEAILSSPQTAVQGFLAAGHVCAVMGYHEYFPIAEKYKVPIVVTGFEPLDLVQGIYLCVKQLEEGRAVVENQYTRSVKEEGNIPAQQLIKKLYTTVNRQWRGIGEIAKSGLQLKEEFCAYDAEIKFKLRDFDVREPGNCISGLVLQGIKKPTECAAFGAECTPEHPLGATMVSSEGACAAYYYYRKGKGHTA